MFIEEFMEGEMLKNIIKYTHTLNGSFGSDVSVILKVTLALKNKFALGEFNVIAIFHMLNNTHVL